MAVRPAWEHEILQPASTMAEPSNQAVPGLFGQLELYRLASLLPNDGRAVSGGSVDDKLADAQLHEVSTAQLAVDGEIEQRQVADATSRWNMRRGWNKPA